MPVSIIPNPYNFPITDIVWPAKNQNYGTGDAFQVNGTTRAGAALSNAVFGALSGAATNNMGLYKTLIAGQFTSTAANTSERPLTGVGCSPMLVAPASSPSTLAMPEHIRVFGWSFLFAQGVAANYTTLSGIAFEPCTSAAPGWINAGNRGFGILGDGAGNWQYNEKNAGGAGVYQTTTALSWPVAFTEWCRVDVIILNATAIAGAKIEVWLDGVRAITSDFGVTGNAATYAQGPANAASYTPHIRCGDALVGQLEIAELRFTAGKFHPVTGTQIGT